MKAYVFPGQGTQFPGMGQSLYDHSPEARRYFTIAQDILGMDIADIMFHGTATQLQETRIAQPAIFLHSVVAALVAAGAPDRVAGHSLGELSALVVSGALSFEGGLWLVKERALAMQQACEESNSTMAAVLGLDATAIDEVCSTLSEEIVVPANYNAPEQTVISGTHRGIHAATALLKQAGATLVVPLAVGGAFHSPLMEGAQQQFANRVAAVTFRAPVCPIYQNVDGLPTQDVERIKANLVLQLTSPVRWTQTVQRMLRDGVLEFVEFGPKEVLKGLIQRIVKQRSLKTAA